MVYQKKTINNVPTKIPLSNSAPVGNPIGTIISTYKKIQPRNYLYCDGSTFDETLYPALYLYLGTNVLPDYRECAIVGAEKNTTDVFDSTETDPSTGLPGTQNHDVYTQGQFKDDQLQGHKHAQANPYPSPTGVYNFQNGNVYGFNNSSTTGAVSDARAGDVTRGKRKAVYYYIKAVDGVDISDEDTFLNTVKDYVDDAIESIIPITFRKYGSGNSVTLTLPDYIKDKFEGAIFSAYSSYGGYNTIFVIDKNDGTNYAARLIAGNSSLGASFNKTAGTITITTTSSAMGNCSGVLVISTKAMVL